MILYRDVFISHAGEDKEPFVRQLVQALLDEGVTVWFDEYELRLGDSLSGGIDRGISHSHHGIVVISHAFFAKNWTQYELNGLIARQTTSGERVIIPIWYNITKDEIIRYSPSLADIIGLDSSRESIRSMATKIAEHIRNALMERSLANQGTNVGQIPPPFIMEKLDGTLITSADLIAVGRPFVIYYFSTWCPLSRSELRELAPIINEYVGQIDFYVVSFEERINMLASYIQQNNYKNVIIAGHVDDLMAETQSSMVVLNAHGVITFRKEYGDSDYIDAIRELVQH